jgi:hypothetical protein
MPTATNHHSTSTAGSPAPSRRALFGAGAALLAGGTIAATAARAEPAGAGTGTTRIAVLNRQIYDLTQRRHELDDIWLKTPKGPEADAAYAAFDATLDPILDLQDDIVGLRAETLEDAAIQAVISFYQADSLASSKLDEADVKEIGQDLRALQASILLVITKSAGLDIDRLGCGELRPLCGKHGPAGRSVA